MLAEPWAGCGACVPTASPWATRRAFLTGYQSALWRVAAGYLHSFVNKKVSVWIKGKRKGLYIAREEAGETSLRP